MPNVSGGVLVARMLKAEGIEYIFSLVGGHIYPIYDACIDEGIKIIDVRHEAAAAHMAEGIALVTGKPGVCLVTAGPGFTNAITGIANAQAAGSPILCISGHSAVFEFDTGALQDIEQIDIIKPLTKYARSVYQTQRIPEYMAAAFRHILSGRPGPSYLEFPMDILYQQVDDSSISMPLGYRPTAFPAGNPDDIQKALDLLKSAKRPVIIAGGGVWWSQAHEILKAFVEKSGIPVFTRNAGRGAISDDHPLCFGQFARTGLFKSDVALIIGTQFTYTLGVQNLPKELKIIRVDIDPTAIGHNRKIDVGIVGDAKMAISQLHHGIQTNSYDDWIKVLKKSENDRKNRIKSLIESDKTPMHPVRLCHELSRFIDEDTIVTMDGGDISAFGSQSLPTYRPGQQLANGFTHFGCLGVGLPFALAAKLAKPEKKVIQLTGDGSFGFNVMEFDTAIRHNLPIVCVIGNDGCWGMIKNTMCKLYSNRDIIGCDLPIRNYEKIVEAMGGYGERVDRPSEIRPAMERAFASGKPACINVFVDPTIGT
jgi:acetolactate synthase I/II/III large subunit